jgi:hypothetical protein
VTRLLLVEVTDDPQVDIADLLKDMYGVDAVYEHNEKYPNGCCCPHCPHGGNCRD